MKLIQTFSGPFSTTLTVHIAKYSNNGHMAVELYDEEGPFTMLSVNLPDDLGPGEFAVKVWGENECVIDNALASGLFEDTGQRVGDVDAPVWRIKV